MPDLAPTSPHTPARTGRTTDRATGVSRRALLRGAITAGAAGALGAALRPGAAVADSAAPAAVVPLAAGLPRRELFAPLEQRLAAYVADIAPIANGISLDPATYGWLRGGWGGRSPDAPYNARVQENVDTLAWFWANPRAWSPYAGDPALLARLDIALGYYLGLQHDDGSWSEYSPTEHSRAATGFGLSFLSQTLGELTRTDALPATRERIATALRTAAAWFLDPTNTAVYTAPVQEYANQAVAGVFGAYEALRVGAATGLGSRLDERISFLHRYAQSPAGFFYEPHGQDLGYNFEVMLPDVAKFATATGDDRLREMAERFYDWLGWNFLREPDGAGWIGNVASSARTYMNFLDDVTDDTYKANSNGLLAVDIPAAAAFEPTAEDKATLRAAFAASTDPVKPFSPYYTNPTTLRDLAYGEFFPTSEAKQAAISRLPYLSHPVRTEYRTDPIGTPLGQQWVYVRRPGVYVGAHFGTRASGIVRTGPGFLWSPTFGTLVHSLNGSTDSCWGTVLGGTAPDVAGDLAGQYFHGDPAGGRHVADPRDVPGGAPVGLAWTAFAGSLTKHLVVGAGCVVSRTEASGAAVEQVPLVLHPDDVLTFDDGTAAAYLGTVTARATGLLLRRSGATVALSWDSPVTARLTVTPTRYFRAKDRALHVLTLPHAGHLEYRITVPTDPA